MSGESAGEVPFQAQVELLRFFLAHRKEVVERIQGVLNAQRQPVQYLQDRLLLSRHFEDCFYTLTAVTENQRRLRGQLQEAYWNSGFRPRQVPGLYNDLVNPAEMMIRGFHCWQQTRWPGRNGRIRYAHTLFDLYVLRCLEQLSLRLWDAEPDSAGDRLAQLQELLDDLRESAPADQPVLVRDARWLIPLAQSPTTDDLAAYFEVAQRVAATLADADRLEAQKASVRMIAGHLRSQIRHYCIKDGISPDENSLVLRTRTSNALDFALLIQGLVPLLRAYDAAVRGDDGGNRLELAGAICQGISPDPELFVNRNDLLRPYSMIEHVFVTTDSDGQAVYTPLGRRHVKLLQEFEALIDVVSQPLYDDCPNFRPVDGAYSPYGVIYGTPSNLTEDMALKTLQRDAVTEFSLEDVFADGDPDADKLAWVEGWRQLPHVEREVQQLYAYPQQFAEDIFDRIHAALRERAGAGEARDDYRTGRLFVVPEVTLPADSNAAQIPDLPIRYIKSSDAQVVAEHRAEPHEQSRLLRDRLEGYYLLSYETSNGWFAISKDFLTEVLGAGADVRIAGLPLVAAGVLNLMCPGLVVAESAVNRAS